MKRALLVGCLIAAVSSAAAQDVSLEYQVKAAYLFNFTKFIDWPAAALASENPFTICIAQINPFGAVLSDALQNEVALGRPLVTRVVGDNASGCHVLFIPRGVPADPYLTRLRTSPVLTVGEVADFAAKGGTIAFVIDGGKVRFAINQEAAERAQLRISSRLLRLGVGAESSQGGTR